MTKVALLVAALAMAHACGQDEDLPPGQCHEDGLFFSLNASGGARPSLFEIIVDLDGESIEHIVCDGDGQVAGLLECTEDGAALRAHPGSVRVVVKAHGYRTAVEAIDVTYQEMSSDEPGCEGGIRYAERLLELVRLADFEVDDDYRTGFDEDEGLAQFESISATTPTEMGAARVVKFYIEDLYGEPAVYFQNTGRHFLHYEFVHGVLGRPFSLDEYEAATYHGEERTAMAGSLILYPELVASSASLAGEAESPLTIEFFPRDDLSPELACLAHRLLAERMLFVPLAGSRNRLFYVPATTDHELALEQKTRSFQADGALWLHREELYGNTRLQLLNPGVAYGTLRLMTPEQLTVTPVSYRDILILTRLPNELPLVGGTITEELQTPLAHVNVAARARGTPNMALIGASSDEAVNPLIGRLVRFEVSELDYGIEATTMDEAQAFWDGLIPDEPTVPDSDVEQDGLWSFADLHFADSIFVGAKAANLAELSQLLGGLAPDGFAVPFHYYDRFMAGSGFTVTLCSEADEDCRDEGRPADACARVTDFCSDAATGGDSLDRYLERMLDDEPFTLDSTFREAALDGFRYLMHHVPVDPDFAEELDGKVLEQFGEETVRLRSSTNAEDLEDFSGAGLYQSVSARVGSDDPPSSQIRWVWASVWNWQAFEERSFWAIDHRAVRMGVAVHLSFPDEAANGVLITRNLADPVVPDGYYVNVQLGEVSVTNPSGGALPEVFSIIPVAGGVQIVRQRYSSLSPGVPVMTEEEIELLYEAARQVQNRFAVLYQSNPRDLVLDLEFKLADPGRRLVIKQVRPYFER